MARLNSAGLSRLARCEAPSITSSWACGMSAASSSERSGRSDRILIADKDQRGRADCGRALRLVGKPDSASAETVGLRIDRRHGLDHVASKCRVLRGQQCSYPGFGEPTHVMARRNRPVVDGLPLRVRREGVGKGQRRASRGCSGVHGDRNDSAERQTADVRLFDPESRHRGEDRGRIIVARGVVAELALAIAGIVERERSARPPEMLELRFPHRFVGADSVEENQGRPIAAADFDGADLSERGFDGGHSREVNGGVRLCNSGFAGETVKPPLICKGAPVTVTSRWAEVVAMRKFLLLILLAGAAGPALAAQDPERPPEPPRRPRRARRRRQRFSPAGSAGGSRQQREQN